MSATIPSPTPVTTPTPVEAQRNRIIASAQSLPDLLAQAETFDPALATKLKGQSTAATATPAGALLGAAIGIVAAKYGFGWDPATVNLVSGAALLAGGYVAHFIQGHITSIVPPKS